MMFALCIATFAQEAGKISGKVVDGSGAPLPGVNVVVSGTTNGTITDADGNYTLSAPEGSVLSFSFIGFKVSSATVVAGQSKYDITLEEDASDLEEVVVMGYGVQKKKLVTGATVQVDGEDLQKLNTTSALDALQSSTPGVQITTTSNQPGGGSFKVYIRGVGTIGDASPLYVIDGVSGGSLSNVAPSDIESIDVLKDAASCAIYGARAANGVILVTTKQGKSGKVKVTYDGYVGWSNVYKRPSTLNAQEYMAIQDEYSFNTTGQKIDWSTKVPADILKKLNDGWEGTDWWEEITNKNAFQQSHAASLTGGSDRSKFALGFSYTSNEGVMGKPRESKYDRFTGRINSEHVIWKGDDRDIITFGENLSLYYTKSNTLAESNSYWNNIHAFLIACPLVPVYDDNGKLYDFAGHSDGWDVDLLNNPMVALIGGTYDSQNKNRSFGFGVTPYLEIEPIKNLRIRSQFNVGYSANSSRYYSTPFSASSTYQPNTYKVHQDASMGSSYSVENTITYKLPELAGNHIDVMVGQAWNSSCWGNSLSVDNSVTEDTKLSLLTDFDHAWITNVSNNTETVSISGEPWGESHLSSFFGRLNWDLNETYMATVVLRRDGSSNFAEGHRWGTFPSVSGGWVLTNNDFMEPTKEVLNFLKLRASWGQNGNCNIANFQYLATVASDQANSYKFSDEESATVSVTSANYGAYANILPNPDVTWETSEQINVGLDARFLDSRLGLTFDWYKKTTKDWLIQAPVLDVMGTNAPYINGGDVENKGIEFDINWRDDINDNVSYHVDFNGAFNKNEVTKIANLQGVVEGGQQLVLQNGFYTYRAQVGEPIGIFYGMSTEGVWQNNAQIEQARANGKAVRDDARPGDLIWVDNDGDGVIDTDKDRHNIGNPNPKFTMGLSFGLDFYGFDFNVTTHGAFGQQILKAYRYATNWNENYTTDIFNRWHGEGTSNKLPAMSSTSSANTMTISDIMIEDGDYLKIQNVTLGYDLRKGFWQSCPLQSVRLYFQAQNLYTFTKYTGCDPEIGSSAGADSWAGGIDMGLYPSSRTYLVGLSVKF
jgi:TonB-linked SusC/RagA family outer membrane protein